jgi:hypothetical protein
MSGCGPFGDGERAGNTRFAPFAGAEEPQLVPSGEILDTYTPYEGYKRPRSRRGTAVVPHPDGTLIRIDRVAEDRPYPVPPMT